MELYAAIARAATHGENRADGGDTRRPLIDWPATRSLVLAPEDDTRGAALMPRGQTALARRLDGSLAGRSSEFEEPWFGRPRP
jgi:hypothetical protein